MEAMSWQEFVETDPCCRQICAQEKLKQHQLFERACASRLCASIVEACNQEEPGCYTFDVAGAGAQQPVTLCIRYKGVVCATCAVDQAMLEAGGADRGMQHFFQSKGRMRPDITLMMHPVGAPMVSALCCECRCQNDRQDALEGYYRAAQYRAEYAADLKCSPKATLVTCFDLPGAYDGQQDVIACNWNAWPHQAMAKACCNEIRKNFQASMRQRRRP